MTEALWKTTASLQEAMETPRTSGPGKLLQIHPVDIHKGLIYLPELGLTIGRSAQCAITVDDDAVSRQHLRIERRDGDYVAVDLGSTNGTFVNDRPVTEQVIAPGDRIRIGKHIFKLLSSDELESQYYDAVYCMMTEDGLTGATNKRAFVDILKRETRRSLNTDRPLSLVLFDVDHFKSINDTHGHLPGDQILQELVARVRNVVESHVVLARYGGEEFALLIPEMNTSQAAIVAERCRETVAASAFETTDGPITVTISLGVADTTTLGPDELAPDQAIIAAADAFLYEAKSCGRNRVCH
ncbi:Response regulator PleD [Maioricimonas rarisocia]|uniref:diguanylate cyclase n=1 Tax=Maioricimonas rarisocia TaxID=2528026 RepID=A0A517Z6Q4_9PLAN|nr:GGDEF domain-containing protein [Maioricimonas rarisocia]QDU38119.1 Response regulator PleD [Maioricimonas rarisocia]